MTLEAGDVLKVMVSPERLQKLKQMGDHELTELGAQLNLGAADAHRMYEVMVPVGSGLAGSSLRQSRFSSVYRARVLGIRQHEAVIMKDLANLQLREGDLLLLHATEDAIAGLTAERHVIVLSQYEPRKVDYRKAIPALLIAAGVVTAAALGITSILISGMVGCLLIVTTGILKPKEAYEAIEWKVIFMMAGVLSMGIALEKTGGSALISGMIFNTMVYAPGNYVFNDFLKFGTPLNIIIWLSASFIIPLFFPF